jgi:crotonobetainyl-CoA hydratase
LPPSGFGGLAERFDLIKPVIAAVNGDAIGGGLEIVLACDLCVSTRNARFALPEPRVGLAASGGLHRLMRQVPEKYAKELALTGRIFSADDAYRFGLANILCEPGAALTQALSLAQEICKGAPLAVQATKQMMDRGREITELEAAFVETYPAFERMINSADADEGRRAFLEKREPRWRAE